MHCEETISPTALSTHWMQHVKTVKLGEICEIIAGQSPPSETYNKEGNGLPFYQGKADFGVVFPMTRMWCSEPQKIAKPNDTLLSVRAPVGPTNLCKEVSCIGRGLAAIRPNDKVDSKYLLYYFKQVEPELSQKGNGSAFAAITQVEVKSLKFPLSDLDTQRHIAAVLDRADALRQKDHQLLTYYGHLPQAVFLEMFGDEQILKQRYEAINLCEVADIVSGVTKNTKQTGTNYIDVPYMRVANVQDGRIDLSEIKTINVPPSDLQKFRLQRNDILLTEGGDPDKLGRGAVWHEEIANCIHQNHIFRVRPNQQLVNPTFLSFLIDSRHGKRYFLKAAKQTTGIASINMQQLKRFPVVVSPIDIQGQFSHAINEIEQQKKLAIAQLATSESLFQSLLHQAFKTGELIAVDSAVENAAVPL